MTPWQVLVTSLVSGLIGALIGHRKGYPVWGFFMGAVLWLLGLVILAFWRPNRQVLVRREAARLEIQRDAQTLIDHGPGAEL